MPAANPNPTQEIPTMPNKCSCRIETNELSEWPEGSGKRSPKLAQCPNEAARYMRIGEVIEHVCEPCYRRDIIYPGAHPATEHDYEMYIESDEY